MKTPIKSIRDKCLDCCGGSSKIVAYCPDDGFNSEYACPLWQYRFGIRPASVRKRYGNQFLTPKDMPDANTPVDDLPTPKPLNYPKQGAKP